MTTRVSRQFRFDSAHRLWRDYKGKCAHNHGHTWTAQVTVEAPHLNKAGMVVDFAELKTLGKWIDEHWDHGTILWREDPMAEYLKKEKHKLFLTEDNPTSEHLAALLFIKAGELYRDLGVRVVEVWVKETPNTQASVST